MEGSKLNWQMKPDSCCHISGVLDLKSSQGCFNTVLCLRFPVVLADPLGRKQQIIQYRNRSSEELKNLRCTVQGFSAKSNLAVSSCFLWITFSIPSYKLVYHVGNPGVNSSSGTKCASGCPHPCYLLLTTSDLSCFVFSFCPGPFSDFFLASPSFFSMEALQALSRHSCLFLGAALSVHWITLWYLVPIQHLKKGNKSIKLDNGYILFFI